MATLIEKFHALRAGEFNDTPVAKYFDVEVKCEYSTVEDGHGTHVRRWPGRQKNVYAWVELVNGKAVGWNENPSRGYSFPVINF